MEDYLEEWASPYDLWLCFLAKARQLWSLEVVYFLLWLIWSNRNTCLQDDKVYKTPATLAATMAARLVSEVEVAARREETITPNRMNPCWSPLPTGYVKINTDAAFNAQSKEVGLGVAVRVVNGRVLLSVTSRTNNVPGFLFAEVYA
ncbi:hypothetical protein CCACVL1_29714 [Corchorus capsularis]|uniref:RNase H type-1 domain-containing protein n=1 Tax=Corchorus capsularis TaxID=210143 RepID=A0A1R3G0D7_COCAP|nr:hypothetical protein CCACVL1_29714 [Corchorus capsularis]